MFTVWELVDNDRDLWFPTNCDTFEQAADVWIEGVQSGERIEIMERVPISIRDARSTPAPKPPRIVRRGARNNSRASAIVATLKQTPGGMSRKQLAEATGLLRTDVGSTVAGLMKRGLVRSEQRPANAELGVSGPGRTTISVYFWTGD